MSFGGYMIVSRIGSDAKGKPNPKLRLPLGPLPEITAAFTEAYPRLKWESATSARSARDPSFRITVDLESQLTDCVAQGLRGLKQISPTRLKAKPSGYVIELAGDPDYVRSVTMALGGRTNLKPLAE